MKISNEESNKIIRLLLDGDCTFVSLVKDANNNDLLYTSNKKGIAPIMDKLNEDRSFFKGGIIADRVIGKAAAMLLIDSGALFIYGEMVSDHSLKILEAASKSNPDFSFEVGKVVPYIINRAGDDMCPMEKTVLNIDDPKDAYEPLKNRLLSMQK